MATAVTTVEQAFEYIDSIRERLDAMEFERLAQRLPQNVWRQLALSGVRSRAFVIERQLDREGMTALNRLRFDEFASESEKILSGEPNTRAARESWAVNQQRRARERNAGLERDLLEARRQLYRHSDDEVLEALKAVDDGRTSASRVANHLWRGDAPHHFRIRVGQALGRLRDAGRVSGTPASEAIGAPNRWAVVDA